jgi:putative transposase
MIALVDQFAPQLGIAAACEAVGLPRATYYRKLTGESGPPESPKPRPKPKRALSDDDRQAVLDVLHDPRFVDLPPTEIYSQLLDEGRYLCSIRTMYRILAENNEVRERRRQSAHPPRIKPQLCATGRIRAPRRARRAHRP